MQLVRGLHNLANIDTPSVLTIGAFDGVHLGHKAIIERVIRCALALDATPTVILFEPQPAEYFNPAGAPSRLSRLRDKVEYLSALGVQRIICLRFNQALCCQSPEDFVKSVLVEGAKVKHLIVGDDFKFGERRAGDFSYLAAAGQRFGFTVEDTPTTLIDQDRVSSTRIRAMLKQGDCRGAAKLLGRVWSVQGRVGYGRQIGRTIGVPTANISLRRRQSPIHGVFAVRIMVAGVEYPAVANVGVKPTVGAEDRPSVEVHIFNFEQNIYGQAVYVFFDKKIRDEQTFGSLEELKQQIALDQAHARAFYAKEPKVIG